MAFNPADRKELHGTKQNKGHLLGYAEGSGNKEVTLGQKVGGYCKVTFLETSIEQAIPDWLNMSFLEEQTL